MPKPCCPKCMRFLRPKQNGVFVLEQKPLANDAPPGTAAQDLWVPYKLWAADEWQCQGCGMVVISGYGLHPVGEDYQPDFQATLERAASFGELRVINDC